MLLYTKLINNMMFDSASINQEKAFIDSLPEPKDDYQRVYQHFLSRFYLADKKTVRKLNVIGMLMIPTCLFLYTLNMLLFMKKDKHKVISVEQTGIADFHYDDRFPVELCDEFGEVFHYKDCNFPDIRKGLMGYKAFAIWFGLFIRYPFYGYMNAYCLVHLMNVNRLLYIYEPKIIVTCRTETNFTASLVSRFCEQRDTEYVCYIHGDYLTDIKRGFVRFTRLYLWDEHYKKVFLWSRSPERQFRVYKPGVYRGYNLTLDGEPEFFFTYYFSGNDWAAEEIKRLMLKLLEHGLRCKVRPHPRFSNKEKLIEIFSSEGILVEDPHLISLIDSMRNTSYVASRNSTVLSEAYFSGKPFIIDDITDLPYFNNMRERMNIQMNWPHKTLSEFIAEYTTSVEL